MASDTESARASIPPSRYYFGKHRGIVTNNEDPRSQGRIKARVPEVLASVESAWALPCAPYGGRGSGMYTVPAVGAGVWIEFEAGGLQRPIWSGSWWASGELPEDEKGQPAAPPRKILRTEKGLMLVLDDGDERISLSDSDGRNLLTIAVQRGRITIAAEAKVVVDRALPNAPAPRPDRQWHPSDPSPAGAAVPPAVAVDAVSESPERVTREQGVSVAVPAPAAPRRQT